MKTQRIFLQKKSRLPSSRRLNIATDCALALIISSIGFVCLFPVNSEAVSGDLIGSVYSRAAETSEGVSLMFNVYWGTEEVYRILDTLEAHSAKATFFIGGCWADDNVSCMKEILARGNEIGNHGYFHKDHSSLDEKANKEEIYLCNSFIKLVTGTAPSLFAPPSGAYGKATIAACEVLNMKTILWSRDTIDWRDKNSSLIYTRATKNIRGGEFVLMHPMKETADALDDILTYYESRSLRAVTVSENLRVGG